MTPLTIGFLPLTDAAPLIAAADFGFAEAEGVRLDLVRDVSWANLRDKLMTGQFDAAQMLAPAAVAATLGIAHAPVPMRAPFVLSRNGNTITLSARLAAELRARDAGALENWRATARVLGDMARAGGRRAPLTFATVFPFSCHTYLLRHFLAEGGLDAGADVQIVVFPPSLMAAAMAAGQIDGFCAGSPWGSVAVASGAGEIVALGSEIFADAPEKVLAVTAGSPLLADETGARLIRALAAACLWLGDAAHLEDVAAALARPGRLDCPPDLIVRTLRGRIVLDATGRERQDGGFLRFSGPGANRPDPAMADWIHGEMVAAGQIPGGADSLAAARAVFGSGVYDQILGNL